MEKMRSERVNLQHEVDILSQKLGAELATLKDEVKGMFNDRKMAVRMEQRAMESSVSRFHVLSCIESGLSLYFVLATLELESHLYVRSGNPQTVMT